MSKQYWVLCLFSLCFSINVVSGQVGFGMNVDAGAYFPDVGIDTVNFSGFISGGIYVKKAYFGLGVGYDRYSDFALLPIMLDFRFVFTGKEKPRFEIDNNSESGFALFFFANAGYSKSVIPKDRNIEGFILYPGLGMLIGKSKNVKFTLTSGYKIQEFTHDTTDSSQGLNVRLGIRYQI